MRFILCLIFLSFSTNVFAQAPADDAQTWEEANKDKPYIGLLSEYDTTLNEDWSYDEVYHARVKIQKEEGKALGEWPIYYNKAREDITEIKAFVETPDGKRFEATKVEDQPVYNGATMYADMKVKVISLPQVNIGSIIDVLVHTKVSRKQIANQFWDEVIYPPIPTKYARHTYVFPADKPVRFGAYNNDTKPIVDKKDGLVKYSFVFEKTAATPDEDFMPPADEIHGVLSLSSISDWKDVALWYNSLIIANTVEDVDISAKAIELARDKATQKDKARAILEFIQDNFRYVPIGIGDHAPDPHSTADVFKNRYGDGQDLSLLTRQLFMLAGINAQICLFSGEFNGDPRHSLPDPSVFDHVVIQVNVDGRKYFVDPQTKGFDIGQLPADYDNGHVMVIEEGGYHFDSLPVGGEDDRSMVSSSNVTVAKDGSAMFDVHVQMPLEASQDFKQTWSTNTSEEKERFYQGLEASFAQGGKMLDHQVKGMDSRYGPVSLELKYVAPNAYPVVNDMIIIKEAQQGQVPDLSAPTRVYPIVVAGNSLIKNSNTYHVPDGMKIDFIPQNYDLGLDFMQVSTAYTKGDNNTITVESLYRMKRATVPVIRYPEVLHFYDEWHKNNDQYIVLKKVSSLSPDAKNWIHGQ